METKLMVYVWYPSDKSMASLCVCDSLGKAKQLQEEYEKNGDPLKTGRPFLIKVANIPYFVG